MLLVPAMQPAVAKRKKRVHPDYTKGEKLEGRSGRYWAPGPTGVISSYKSVA